MATRQLTPQQQRFVREYMVDLNATRAAIRAGYKAKNANVVGPRLVGKSRVRRAIDQLMKVGIARTEAAADRALRELLPIADSDIGDYFVDDRGRLRVHPSAGPGALKAVRKFEHKKRVRTKGRGKNKVTETQEVVEIRMMDKLKVLRLLCRHLGMLKRMEPDSIDERIAELPPEIADRLGQLLRDAVAAKTPPQPEQPPTATAMPSSRSRGSSDGGDRRQRKGHPSPAGPGPGVACHEPLACARGPVSLHLRVNA